VLQSILALMGRSEVMRLSNQLALVMNIF
jgi:hypothetical protein